MTPDRPAEIRQQAAEDAQIAARATPGPWRYDDMGYVWGPQMEMVADHGGDEDEQITRMRGVGAQLPLDENGKAIAHARTAVPRLAAAVEELAAEVKRLNDKLEKWETEFSYLEPE